MGLRYSFIAWHVICVVFEWLSYFSSVHATNCSLSHLPLCPSSVGNENELDCFQWLDKPRAECVWEAGSSTNISRFKLLVETPNVIGQKICTEYSIKGTSVTLKSMKKTGNMAAYIAEKGSNCTMGTFQGSLAHIFRCTAVNVELQRRSGQLFVKASWNKKNDVQKYLVKYREYSTNNSKNFSKELSQHQQSHTIENLNSSVSYEVQVQCINSSKCTQCTPSQFFTVPQELTTAPIIKCTVDGFHQERRKVIISWESLSPSLVTQHSVRVQKVSEEFYETFIMNSSDSSISLYLSHSAYHVHLYSSNNVSQSPPASCTVEPALKDMGIKGALRVAFISNHSFNLLWSDSLRNAYECYTVEWLLKGGDAMGFRSFYSHRNHSVIDIEKEASFLPYKRYVFLLHVKPYKKRTCNLKQLNNSDITRGWTEAYLLEGTPVSDPQNVSQSNVTDCSVTISWLPVPEEELHGFLLGYIISYVNENTKSTSYMNDSGTNLKSRLIINVGVNGCGVDVMFADNSTVALRCLHTTRKHQQLDITLGPGISSYTLSGLKSRSDYQVEVAAFTSKGEGKRSPPLYFETNPSDHSGWILGGVIGSASLLVAVQFCFRLLNRVKEVLWPSIPNPSNSSAIQKINSGYELEPIMETNGLKLQEHVDSGPLYLTEYRKENRRNAGASLFLDKQNCDTSSLSFCSEAMERPSNGIEKPECLHSTEIPITEVACTPSECANKEFGSSGITHTPFQRTEAAAAAATALAGCDPRPTVTFMSDYTTMELFQQATMAVQAECHAWPPMSLMPNCPPPTGLDYVDQSHFYTQ